MPELPEVETVRRGLAPAMVGVRIVAVEQRRANLRFAFPERFAERLQGARVDALSRRAKFLAADLDTGETLIMHLGMSGRFVVEMNGESRAPGEFQQDTGRLPAHDHVVLTFSNGARITYNDVRRFGFMLLAQTAELASHPQFVGLGVEPLGNGFHAEALNELFADKATPLKAALLDQRLIAGLGNIYVCEALHRAHLSPFRAAGEISGPGRGRAATRDLLTATIKDVLNEAIEAGGSSLKDYAHTDGSLGYFQHRFKVYDREGEPCPEKACSGVILRAVQSGRSTYYCAACQK